jgi:hypothetical protein
MLRIATRGFVIVLALLFVVASAGTVLCEMDCAAVGHAASSVAMTPMNNGASHCDGEQIDSAQQALSAHHGSSGGNAKHGTHSHSGIVATVTARVLLSPARAFFSFTAAPITFGVTGSAHVKENSWNNNSSPPMNCPSAFATGILRI